MQIGLYTFGDLARGITAEKRYAEILAAAKLADESGLGVFGVGEHHRLDIPIASPAVVMAAIAQTTKRIRLTSAVTILSTLDPVRVFQDFATVDLLSGGTRGDHRGARRVHGVVSALRTRHGRLRRALRGEARAAPRARPR